MSNRELAKRILGVALLFGLLLAAISFTPAAFFALHSGWYITATSVIFALAFVGDLRGAAGHLRRLGANLLGLIRSVKPALVVAGVALALSALANKLNEAKISLLTTPLTYQDLQIAARSPQGFLDAIKFSFVPAALVAIGAILIVLFFLVRWLRRNWSLGVIARRLAPALVALAFLWTSAVLYSRRLEHSIHSLDIAEEAWTPAGLLALSAKLGAVPFLFLTSRYGALNPELLDESGQRSPVRDARASDPPQRLKPIAEKAKLPNVVVVLLESTFDISQTFDIRPALTSPLFPNMETGQLQGLMGVDTVGGGTWISEFEAIVGIPARVFGFAGNYTHVSVAPYISGTLASYLKEKGYESIGLYPTETRFYSAREAYAKYGFDRMLGAEDMAIDKPWFVKDTDLIERYVAPLSNMSADKPYFAFALTIENHAPHACGRFVSEADMPFRLVDDATPRATCELNEYVARMRSTEAAIRILENTLREREKATGRPYVLALFGDHQPHTFTSTGKTPLWSAHDYSRARRLPADVTLYQIRSSAASPFADRRLDVPIVLLPTLISAYVAASAQDLYLPKNMDVADRCGISTNGGERDAVGARPQRRDEDCRRALSAALPDYRRLLAIH